MDPLTNLKEQRILATEILRTDEGDSENGYHLAELVLALDEWRNKGGFDPYVTNTPSLAELDRFNDMQRRALTAEAKLVKVRDILTTHLESGSEG